jgi:hypothetical protein
MGVGGVAVVAQPVGGMQRRAGSTKKKSKKKKTESEQFPTVATPGVDEIASKHGVDKRQIQSQLQKGIKVEYEHTTDKAKAREIALDHLNELPDYYDRLATVEESAPKTGEYTYTVLYKDGSTEEVIAGDTAFSVRKRLSGTYPPPSAREMGIKKITKNSQPGRKPKGSFGFNTRGYDAEHRARKKALATEEGNKAQKGIPANATDAELKSARSAGGEKGQRAHWLLNMRKGNKKK